MARKAIISDMHGNLEATIAVFKDIDEQNIENIICIGDVIGYGANPGECLDELIKRNIVSTKGNHESAILAECYEYFRPEARRSLLWTREQLYNSSWHFIRKIRRINFLHSMREKYPDETGALYLHGSPRDWKNEYLSSGDYINYIYKRPGAKRKLDVNFERFSKLCFNGHNHIPGLIIKVKQELEREIIDYQKKKIILTSGYNLVYPKELTDGIFELKEEEQVLVNVGSVGQPRNCDPSASYFIYDTKKMTVQCRRISYDILKAAAKIKKLGFRHLAERLTKGE
ncbi:metallophosphoesterase [Candidatus Woesearchaeota archaeon]|nr:metallophosphoesterase [Candidatus Woesearchaeota archaeon]